MNQNELKKRTQDFALRIIRLVDSLDREIVAGVLGKQLLRAGTSVGANYRAACRARSRAEFIAKIGVVLEESDECSYWLELIVESGRIHRKKVAGLLNESNELTAIFASTHRSAKTDRSSSIQNQK